MQDNEKVGKIVIGCGGLMFALCLLGGFVFAIIAATSNGRISPSEAVPGYISSCSFSSLLVLAAGIALLMKGQKDRRANGG